MWQWLFNNHNVFIVGASQALNCYLCMSLTSEQGCGVDDFDPSVARVQNANTFVGSVYESVFNCSVCAVSIYLFIYLFTNIRGR